MDSSTEHKPKKTAEDILAVPPKKVDNCDPPTVDKPFPGNKDEDISTDSKHLNRLNNAKAADAENNTDLRKKTANYAAWYAGASLFLWVLVVLISLNYSMLNNGKEIFNDTKFIAITTGCTVNSVAAFIAVVRGLFRSPEK